MTRSSLTALLVLAALAGGCSQVEIRPSRDPESLVLTDSFASVYDADSSGLWYVVFLKCDGLLAAIHRHDPGIHLFVRPNEDLLFASRCSGRGEVIDVQGKTFWLKNGAVLLCDAEGSEPRIKQIDMPLPPCRADDPPSIEKTLAAIARQRDVAEFLSWEARGRLSMAAGKKAGGF